MHARQVFYSGHVQGVGFRYTVRNIASGYEVTGWVKNLPDGRVELHAVAHESQELEDFLEAVRTSSLSGHIRNVEMNEVTPPAGVKGFNVVH
jgi:acylphosphatase